MLIEQPPILYRMLFPETFWRIPGPRNAIYLTFDDGPIPEVTPWVLDLLDKYGIKATFFCVGDNVVKHRDIYDEILRRGHHTGNHTMNHIQGLHYSPRAYTRNVELADKHIGSILFRPPHGHMMPAQVKILQRKYRIIMWDVVTRDYSKKVTKEQVFENVKRYVRNGSIIVFHDSLKAEKKLRYALPLSLEWMLAQGYEFALL
ncbi:MAG: polysaccharide deacetylase family protein [Bacteroidaceae bacterium]|nr:polysaccharide deacetylase family protein [Bacteroidaceae bacterium]